MSLGIGITGNNVVKGSGGGTSNYSLLSNKPKINSIELSGDKTANDLELLGISDIVDSLAPTDSDKPISARAVNEDLINYIDGSISDTLTYVDQLDNSEHAGRVAGDNLLDSKKADKIVVGTSQPAGGMLPDAVYNLGTLSGSVTFSLAAAVSGNVNHYFWTFSTGATAPTITWPNGITWQGGSAPTINASKHYDVSILNGYGVAMEA